MAKFKYFLVVFFFSALSHAGEIKNRPLVSDKAIFVYHMDESTCCLDTSTNNARADFQGVGLGIVKGVFGNGIQLMGNTINTGSFQIANFNKSISDWTIVGWFQNISTSARENIVTAAGAGNWGLYVVGNSMQVNNDNAGGCAESISGGTSVSSTTWQRWVAVRRNGISTELWVNGVLDTTTVNTACGSFVAVPWLGSQNGVSQFYNGQMDEVAMFERAWTPGEIRDDYLSRKNAKAVVSEEGR